MKLSQSGSTTTLTLIALVFVTLIGVGIWQSGVFDDDSSLAEPITTTEESLPEAELPGADDSQTSMLIGPEIVEGSLEEAVLEPVDGFTGSGTAANQRNTEGDTIHEIIAQLDEPAEGKFYEGWLVGPSMISTGALESEGDQDWSLIFTTNQDISEHDNVVITEESLANGLDGVPETPVLEGSF